MNEILFEWLTPQGIIALGVAVGLIQQGVGMWRTAKAVKVLQASTEAAHSAAVDASSKADQIHQTLEEVKLQTNGMSHRLETLAGEAGEARGRAAGRKEP